MPVASLSLEHPLPAAARVAEPAPETRVETAVPKALADYESTFLEHLEFIERTVATLARRNAVSPADAEDLEGQVKLRLTNDNYAVLRKFQGRSKLTTYLTTVIHNVLRDFRVQRWGKWRPSAAARRMGELGVQLETLLYRDGLGHVEAIAILRDRFGAEFSDREIESMIGRLRPRSTRRFEGEAALDRLAAPDRADRCLKAAARRQIAAKTRHVLRKCLASFETEDRMILRMHFADGLTLRAIADSLKVKRRRIYPRVQRLLSEVKRQLERHDVTYEEVLDLLDHWQSDLDLGLASSPVETKRRASADEPEDES